MDNDRQNNRPVNLKWVSHAENISHKVAHGTNGLGERHPRAKVTEAGVIEIRRRAANREGHASIARDYAIGASGIYDIVSRRRWRHVEGEAMKARAGGIAQVTQTLKL